MEGQTGVYVGGHCASTITVIQKEKDKRREKKKCGEEKMRYREVGR